MADTCPLMALTAKGQTLEVIDQSAVETGKVLRMYSADEKDWTLLETFADCPKIVKWICEQTKGTKCAEFLIV